MFKLLIAAAVGLIASSEALNVEADSQAVAIANAYADSEIMVDEPQKRKGKRQIRNERRRVKQLRRDERRRARHMRRALRHRFWLH